MSWAVSYIFIGRCLSECQGVIDEGERRNQSFVDGYDLVVAEEQRDSIKIQWKYHLHFHHSVSELSIDVAAKRHCTTLQISRNANCTTFESSHIMMFLLFIVWSRRGVVAAQSSSHPFSVLYAKHTNILWLINGIQTKRAAKAQLAAAPPRYLSGTFIFEVPWMFFLDVPLKYPRSEVPWRYFLYDIPPGYLKRKVPQWYLSQYTLVVPFFSRCPGGTFERYL